MLNFFPGCLCNWYFLEYIASALLPDNPFWQHLARQHLLAVSPVYLCLLLSPSPEECCHLCSFLLDLLHAMNYNSTLYCHNISTLLGCISPRLVFCDVGLGNVFKASEVLAPHNQRATAISFVTDIRTEYTPRNKSQAAKPHHNDLCWRTVALQACVATFVIPYLSAVVHEHCRRTNADVPTAVFCMWLLFMILVKEAIAL